MFDDMVSDKKLNKCVTELFIRGRKLAFLLHLFSNQTTKYQNMLD